MAKDFVPRPYQAYAIKRICEQRAVGLFLDMGMGKTVITLMAIRELLYNYFDVERVLVIAPLRVAESTWIDESREWTQTKSLTISAVLGTQAARKGTLTRKADIYTINRES